MSLNWWTRKSLVLAAAMILVTCAFGLALGMSTPEPGASAALGPDWKCSRVVFVFTSCSRIKHTLSTAVQIAKIPVCGRLRT